MWSCFKLAPEATWKGELSLDYCQKSGNNFCFQACYVWSYSTRLIKTVLIGYTILLSSLNHIFPVSWWFHLWATLYNCLPSNEVRKHARAIQKYFLQISISFHQVISLKWVSASSRCLFGFRQPNRIEHSLSDDLLLLSLMKGDRAEGLVTCLSIRGDGFLSQYQPRSTWTDNTD